MCVDVTELVVPPDALSEFVQFPRSQSFSISTQPLTIGTYRRCRSVETEAFAILRHDSLRQTPATRSASVPWDWATAAMTSSVRRQGPPRSTLPHASIVCTKPRSGARVRPVAIQIRAQEVLHNKRTNARRHAPREHRPQRRANSARISDRIDLPHACPRPSWSTCLIESILTSQKGTSSGPVGTARLTPPTPFPSLPFPLTPTSQHQMSPRQPSQRSFTVLPGQPYGKRGSTLSPRLV